MKNCWETQNSALDISFIKCGNNDTEVTISSYIILRDDNDPVLFLILLDVMHFYCTVSETVLFEKSKQFDFQNNRIVFLGKTNVVFQRK